MTEYLVTFYLFFYLYMGGLQNLYLKKAKELKDKMKTLQIYKLLTCSYVIFFPKESHKLNIRGFKYILPGIFVALNTYRIEISIKTNINI